MVYGQMNEPPGNRLRVALTGLTMAEYFRDEKTKQRAKAVMFCCSLIIFIVTHWQVLRYQHF